MVAELLRLRLHSLANDVRSGPRRWFGAVVAALLVLVASLAVAFLVSGLRASGVDEVRAVVVGGGSLLLLGFAVVPLANVRAPWSDPRRLATLGVPERSAALGLALGAAVSGFLPIAEIQYLAYLHNAEDQLRGEAATLQFFSQRAYRNGMVVRIAGYGYQRGFGGHFHNDDAVGVLRDIPGLVVGCPSRGDDAATMLRTLTALAKVDGRVAVLLEPIAQYMTKDLYDPGDGAWLTQYPAPDTAMTLGEGRTYGDGDDLVIISYGEERPAESSPGEDSWAKNRRVDFKTM